VAFGAAEAGAEAAFSLEAGKGAGGVGARGRPSAKIRPLRNRVTAAESTRVFGVTRTLGLPCWCSETGVSRVAGGPVRLASLGRSEASGAVSCVFVVPVPCSPPAGGIVNSRSRNTLGRLLLSSTGEPAASATKRTAVLARCALLCVSACSKAFGASGSVSRRNAAGGAESVATLVPEAVRTTPDSVMTGFERRSVMLLEPDFAPGRLGLLGAG
jgi:hypothetical protein